MSDKDDEAVIDEVMESISARRSALIDKMTSSIRAAIPIYDEYPDAELAAELHEHVRLNVDTFLACTGSGRRATQQDLAFIREAMEHRVDQGVALDDVLHAFRVGLQSFWEVIVEESRKLDSGGDGALLLALPAMQYIDLASAEVTETYVRIEERRRASAHQARAQLLTSLLSGQRPSERGRLAAADSFPLGAESIYQVCVLIDLPEARADDVRRGIELVAARAPFNGCLAEVEGGRLTVAFALTGDSGQETPAAIADVVAGVEGAGACARTGIGLPGQGLDQIPLSFREASAAATRARPGAIIAMTELPVIERAALVLGSSDASERIVPPRLRELVREDRAGGGNMIGTVLAYFENDLNAKRAAKQLFVHPNTVHYRLEGIAERTGLDPRQARDALDLVTSIRLLAAAPGSPSPND